MTTSERSHKYDTSDSKLLNQSDKIRENGQSTEVSRQRFFNLAHSFQPLVQIDFIVIKHKQKNLSINVTYNQTSVQFTLKSS